MKPIPFWLLFFFTATFLTFTACQKKGTTPPETPPVIITPVDTPVFNPIITSIVRLNGELRDTFIYDGNNRLIEYYYTNRSQKPPGIGGRITFTYDASGKLSRVNFPGYNHYFTGKYYNGDSFVLSHSDDKYNPRYKLDTSGIPTRLYNQYVTSDTIQRIYFSWEINPLTGNAEVEYVYYYPTPNYDPLPDYDRVETNIFEYSNVENPLYPIAKYNPVFTRIALANTWHPTPSMSRHMLSAYYWKDYYSGVNQLKESYGYTLDSMGKYPVRQVEYFTNLQNTKDSSVALFIYRNAK